MLYSRPSALRKCNAELQKTKQPLLLPLLHALSPVTCATVSTRLPLEQVPAGSAVASDRPIRGAPLRRHGAFHEHYRPYWNAGSGHEPPIVFGRSPDTLPENRKSTYHPFISESPIYLMALANRGMGPFLGFCPTSLGHNQFVQRPADPATSHRSPERPLQAQPSRVLHGA